MPTLTRPLIAQMLMMIPRHIAVVVVDIDCDQLGEKEKTSYQGDWSVLLCYCSHCCCWQHLDSIETCVTNQFYHDRTSRDVVVVLGFSNLQ